MGPDLCANDANEELLMDQHPYLEQTRDRLTVKAVNMPIAKDGLTPASLS